MEHRKVEIYWYGTGALQIICTSCRMRIAALDDNATVATLRAQYEAHLREARGLCPQAEEGKDPK